MGSQQVTKPYPDPTYFRHRLPDANAPMRPCGLPRVPVTLKDSRASLCDLHAVNGQLKGYVCYVYTAMATVLKLNRLEKPFGKWLYRYKMLVPVDYHIKDFRLFTKEKKTRHSSNY